MTELELLNLVIAKVRSAGAGGLTTAQDLRDVLNPLIGQHFDDTEALADLITSGLSGKVNNTGTETIGGAKTFSSPVICSAAPTLGTHLVTKDWVEALVSTITSSTITFNSNRVITRETPGIEGVNLGETTLLPTIEKLLYPSQSPLIAATIPNTEHEYGDSTNILVTWTATKRTSNITAITIGGVTVTPTGNTQSGTTNVAKLPTANSVLDCIVSDGTLSRTVQLTNYVRSKLRIGGTLKDGNVAPILDADINAAPSHFATSNAYEGTLTVGASEYLMIAVPTAFGDPKIFINGMLNTYFTKRRSSSAYVNSFGYSGTFDVWVSDNFMTGPVYIKLV